MPQITREIISYCNRNKYAIVANVVTAAIFGSTVGSFVYKPEVVDFLVSKTIPLTQSLIMCNAFTVFSPVTAIAFNNIIRGKNVLSSLAAMSVLAFNISNLLSTAKTFTPAEENDIEENWNYEKSDLTTENLLSRSTSWSLFLPTMAAAATALFAYIALRPLDKLFNRDGSGNGGHGGGGAPGGGSGGGGAPGGGPGSAGSDHGEGHDSPPGGGHLGRARTRSGSRAAAPAVVPSAAAGGGRVVQRRSLGGTQMKIAIVNGEGDRYPLRGPREWVETAKRVAKRVANVVADAAEPFSPRLALSLRFEAVGPVAQVNDDIVAGGGVAAPAVGQVNPAAGTGLALPLAVAATAASALGRQRTGSHVDVVGRRRSTRIISARGGGLN